MIFINCPQSRCCLGDSCAADVGRIHEYSYVTPVCSDTKSQVLGISLYVERTFRIGFWVSCHGTDVDSNPQNPIWPVNSEPPPVWFGDLILLLMELWAIFCIFNGILKAAKVDGSQMYTVFFTSPKFSPGIWNMWFVPDRGCRCFSSWFSELMSILFIIKLKILMLDKWMYRSPQLCWLLSLEWLLYFEHAIQAFLSTCLFGMCSWSHT